MKSLSLYGITEEFEALNELLDESGGEVSESHEQLIEYVESLLTAKVDGIKEWHDQQADLIKLAADRIKALQAYKKSIENRLSRFDNYVGMCLEKTGRAKFEGSMCEVKARKPAKAVEITDESAIPMEFTQVETVVKVLKSEIKDALKLGKDVPGAKLVDGKTSLIFGYKK